jgi:hypothetical protein
MEHVILPGDQVTVWLAWPTPENGATPYSNHAEIWTNDPDRPQIRFRTFGMTGPVEVTRPAR